MWKLITPWSLRNFLIAAQLIFNVVWFSTGRNMIHPSGSLWWLEGRSIQWRESRGLWPFFIVWAGETMIVLSRILPAIRLLPRLRCEYVVMNNEETLFFRGILCKMNMGYYSWGNTHPPIRYLESSILQTSLEIEVVYLGIEQIGSVRLIVVAVCVKVLSEFLLPNVAGVRWIIMDVIAAEHALSRNVDNECA